MARRTGAAPVMRSFGGSAALLVLAVLKLEPMGGNAPPSSVYETVALLLSYKGKLNLGGSGPDTATRQLPLLT